MWRHTGGKLRANAVLGKSKMSHKGSNCCALIMYSKIMI